MLCGRFGGACAPFAPPWVRHCLRRRDYPAIFQSFLPTELAWKSRIEVPLFLDRITKAYEANPATHVAVMVLD